jgi:hypothetical protein
MIPDTGRNDDFPALSSHSGCDPDAPGDWPALFDGDPGPEIDFLLKFFLLGIIRCRPGVWDDWFRDEFQGKKKLIASENKRSRFSHSYSKIPFSQMMI